MTQNFQTKAGTEKKKLICDCCWLENFPFIKHACCGCPLPVCFGCFHKIHLRYRTYFCLGCHEDVLEITLQQNMQNFVKKAQIFVARNYFNVQKKLYTFQFLKLFLLKNRLTWFGMNAKFASCQRLFGRTTYAARIVAFQTSATTAPLTKETNVTVQHVSRNLI